MIGYRGQHYITVATVAAVTASSVALCAFMVVVQCFVFPVFLVYHPGFSVHCCAHVHPQLEHSARALRGPAVDCWVVEDRGPIDGFSKRRSS